MMHVETSTILYPAPCKKRGIYKTPLVIDAPPKECCGRTGHRSVRSVLHRPTAVWVQAGQLGCLRWRPKLGEDALQGTALVRTPRFVRMACGDAYSVTSERV